MSERRIPRDPSPSPNGRAADDVVAGVPPTSDPSREVFQRTSTAVNPQTMETKRQQPTQQDSTPGAPRSDPPPVAPGAVHATNQSSRMAGIKSGPDF